MTRPIKNLAGFIGTGDATHFGTNDLDKVNYLFTGQDQTSTDPVDMATLWSFRNNRFNLWDSSGTYKYNFISSALGASRNVTVPALTADDQWSFDKNTTAFQNKTVSAELNTLVNMFNRFDYTIYLSGGLVKARNWSTGVTTSNSDASTLINSVIASMTNGGSIAFMDTVFTLNSPLVGWANWRPYYLQGLWDNSRAGGTRLAVGATFPTNDYVIKCANAVGSNNLNVIFIDGFEFYNLQVPTINAGAILYESDRSTYGATLIASNIWMQYMWRGIHLKGPAWNCVIRNVHYNSNSPTFVGNAMLIMEGAGHADVPKGNLIEHISANGDTNSILDNFFNLIEAGYNVFIDIFPDGFKYNEAVFAIRGNTQGNLFYHVYVLDTNVSTGTNVACLLLDGAGGTLACANNRFYDSYFTIYPYAVAIRNGAQRNHIEIPGWHGSNSNILDSGAGANNEVVITAGSTPVATADAKITSTNGVVDIRDRRPGASNRGLSATQSGNPPTTIFNIPHGCFATPAYINVIPALPGAVGNFSLSATSTNIVVTYSVAPPSGTNNLQWYWNAEVYS